MTFAVRFVSGGPADRVNGLPVRGCGLALVLFAASACAADSARPSAEVVDSAGIRIVTYDLTDAVAPVYRVLGEHDLEIGVLEGDPAYTFSRITDLALGDAGQVLVSDGVTQEIRVFDDTGTYRRAIGRNGEGPGEFATAPSIIDVAGDTVFAFDTRNRRISGFLLTGELVGETAFRTGEGGRPQAALRLSDGSYLARSTWIDPGTEPESHDIRLELDSIVIERRDATGAVMDTLDIVAERTRARLEEVLGDGRFRMLQAVPPYAAQTQVRSDGSRLVLAHRDAFRIDWIDPSTGREATLRVLGVQHPATAEEIRERQLADIRAELGDEELDRRSYQLNVEFLPERLPPLGAVIVSDAGDVWVALTEFDMSEGLDWLVFSPDSELRGTVHTPPEFRLQAIRSDYVVGFVLSELDVPYVRRYPLSAEAPG